VSVYGRLSVEGGAATVRRRSRDLDAMRAIAVLMVLAGHAYAIGGAIPAHTSTAPTDMVVNAGGAGIWLFFALSGYLIALPFLRALLRGEPLPDGGRYAVRRAARILPAYWIALFVLLLLLPVAGLEWWQPLVHVALLHNLFPGEGQALFFVAWTLGIEALFYAFVPLAALAVRRLAGPRALPARTLLLGVLALWAASVAWTVVAAVGWPGQGLEAVRWADVTRLSLPALLSAFCPGLLVAVAQESDAPWLRRIGARPVAALAAAVALAAGGMLLYTAGNSVVFDLSHQLWSLAAGLVLVVALAGWGPAGRPLRLLGPIGLISYGLYLWHYVVTRLLLDQGVSIQAGGLSWPVRIAVVLALAVPLATASWLLVERPLLRRTARWWERRSTTVPATSPA